MLRILEHDEDRDAQSPGDTRARARRTMLIRRILPRYVSLNVTSSQIRVIAASQS